MCCAHDHDTTFAVVYYDHNQVWFGSNVGYTGKYMSQIRTSVKLVASHITILSMYHKGNASLKKVMVVTPDFTQRREDKPKREN